MALNSVDENITKFSLDTVTGKIVKYPRYIFKLLSIVSVICLLLVFHQRTDIIGDFKLIFDLQIFPMKAENCSFDKTVIRRSKSPFSGIAIDVTCSFLDRVRVFNVALDHLRLAHLRGRQSNKWQQISAPDKIIAVGDTDTEFFQQLENFSQIETVFLPWIHNNSRNWTSFEDTSNILINKYFDWTADSEICQWIDSPCENRYIIHSETCTSDIRNTENPQSFSLLELNSRPINETFDWPKKGEPYLTYLPPFAFYLHIIKDCIVTLDSEVWSGNMYLVQRTCGYKKNTRPPKNIGKLPIYDEVIALSVLWGHAVYHLMIEVIPRLSLYIDFLTRNPQVKILVSRAHGRALEFLSILGFSKNRIITGICRAKLLYLPRSTMCCWANTQEIQYISLLYRKYINENFISEKRDKIILIQRSGKRKFAEHVAIEDMVKKLAAAHNLSFVLFPDNPVPSLNRTMVMFHSAVMVVAPHGAGLSNVVFSQPGTYVIEGVCNPPYVNLCFRRLSYVLGHHWHGIHSQGGCPEVIKISVSSMEAAVEKHLEFLKK